MKTNIKRIFVIVFLFTSILAISCDMQFFQNNSDTGSIELEIASDIFENTNSSNLVSKAIQLNEITSIKISIIGSNITTPIEDVFTINTSNGSSGTVVIEDIPIGLNRAVKVSALDSSGNVIPGLALYGTLDVFPGNNTATIDKNSTPRGKILWDLVEYDLNNSTNLSSINCSDIETFIQQVISDNNLTSALLVDAEAISTYMITNLGALPHTTAYIITPAEITLNISGIGQGIKDSQIIVNDPLSNAQSLIGDGSYSIKVYPGNWKIKFTFFNNLYTREYFVNATTQGATISNAIDDQGNPIDLSTLDFSGDVELTIDAGAMTYTPVSTISFQNYQMYVPQGLVIPNVQPSGDFDGAVIQNPDGDFAGFGAVTPTYINESNAATVLNNRIGLISSSGNGNLNLISQRQNTTGNMINAQYSYTVPSPITIIDLNNQILSWIGLNVQGGTITNLPPSLNTSNSYSNFRYFITIQYISSTEIIIISSIVPESQIATFESLVNGFNDGTNIGSSSSSMMTTQDAFTAQSGNNLADFLFVIDNSGSMSDEQTAISSAASEFWSKMNSAGLDFKAGVITTDSQTLRGTGFTSDQNQFVMDVRPGTSGNSTERGIYFAETALRSIALGDSSNGSVVTAGFPRPGASLSVIIMSDEMSQYLGVFDPNNNLFIDRSYKVYSIIDIYSPGQYDDLSNSTGGIVASIKDISQFPTIMTQIATDAGGATSSYVLTNTPISSTIAVYINNNLVPQSSTDGWAYIESNNSIVFYGSYIPNSGETINIVYNWIN
ncbi:MAG: hypothetical protein ACPKOI_08055 [Pleomorphochaeta sp.]